MGIIFNIKETVNTGFINNKIHSVELIILNDNDVILLVASQNNNKLLIYYQEFDDDDNGTNTYNGFVLNKTLEFQDSSKNIWNSIITTKEYIFVKAY